MCRQPQLEVGVLFPMNMIWLEIEHRQPIGSHPVIAAEQHFLWVMDILRLKIFPLGTVEDWNRRKETVEKLYYSMGYEPICICSSEDNLDIPNDSYPICEFCEGLGKPTV